MGARVLAMKSIGLAIATAAIGFLVMPACQSTLTETTTLMSTVSTTATITETRVTTLTPSPVTQTITEPPATITQTMTTTQVTTVPPLTQTQTVTTTVPPLTQTQTVTTTRTYTPSPVTTTTTAAVTITTTTTATVSATANLAVYRSEVGGVTVITVLGAGFDSNEVVALALRAAANGEDLVIASGIVCSASGTFTHNISPALLEGVDTGTYTLEASGRGGSVAVVALTVK